MIYLDYHATSPCDPNVIDAMMPYFGQMIANPSSIMHQAGRDAANDIERSRELIGKLIGANSREIIFTSGATESNNLALQGISRGNISQKNKFVTCSIEKD
jgi:cysteine desulfurase